MSALGPSFTAHTPRALKRVGFRGRTVTVVLTGDLVGLVGAEGGDRPIPIDQIAGLRAGLVKSRHGQYPQLRLFLADRTTLRLDATADAGDAAAARRSYPLFVRSLAARLAASGRLAAIETGVSRVWTGIFTVLLALPAAAMIGIAAWVWLAPPMNAMERWIARGFTSLVAVVLTPLPFLLWRAHWPRGVTALAELDRALPHA